MAKRSKKARSINYKCAAKKLGNRKATPAALKKAISSCRGKVAKKKRSSKKRK